MSWSWSKTIGIYLTSFVIGISIWKFKASFWHSADDHSQNRPTSDLFNGRNEVLVFVGDAPITQEDLDWEIDQYLRTLPSYVEQNGQLDPKAKEYLQTSLREKLLENTIERKLLMKLIERDHSFSVRDPKRFIECEKQFRETIEGPQADELTKGEKRIRDYLCEKDIITQYFSEIVYSKIKIPEDEIKDYFQRNSSRFNSPEKVQIRHILLASENDAKKARARVNADNFPDLAKTMSIAPEAEQGGRLKPYARGELPAVFDIAFSLKVGEVSQIQKSNYGFHIFMLEKRLPKFDANLAAARGKISAELREQKKREEFKRQLELAFNSVQVRRPRPLW